MKMLKELKGVKVISKNEQKNVIGGAPWTGCFKGACDPGYICVPGPHCIILVNP